MATVCRRGTRTTAAIPMELVSTAHAVLALARGLADEWDDEASLLRRRGQQESAALLQSCAEDLREAVQAWLDEPIKLGEAAELAGLAYSTLQHLVAEGAIPNAGEKHRPRVRRRYLPIRPRVDEPVRRDPEDPAADLVSAKLRGIERSG